MSVSAINPSANTSALLAAANADSAASSKTSVSKKGTVNDPVAVKKAAAQFEAIILRQLLSPAIEPVMSGGLGGEKSAGSGMYGYMMTDALADNLSKGGGLGLAKMLEKQFTPHAAKTQITSSTALKSQPSSDKSL